MTQPSPDLAERYGAPSRARRPLVVAVVVLLAVAGAAWMVWVVGFHGRPEVSSQMVGYEVPSRHAATATFTVVRRDSGIAASCLLRALASDHSVVGELSVPVASGPTSATLRASVRTERRAGSVELVGCSTPDRPARQ